jgi:hypothetical protein
MGRTLLSGCSAEAGGELKRDGGSGVRDAGTEFGAAAINCIISGIYIERWSTFD